MYLDEADNLILEDGDERINKTAFFLNLKEGLSIKNQEKDAIAKVPTIATKN